MLVFPGGTSGKELSCQCRRHKRHGFDPWVRKIPWKRAWQPTPAFSPGESHGQRSLAGYNPHISSPRKRKFSLDQLLSNFAIKKKAERIVISKIFQYSDVKAIIQDQIVVLIRSKRRSPKSFPCCI